MNEMLLSPISLRDFETLIRTCVKSELQNITPAVQSQPEYITRKEAARILGISLPTLNEWSKRGILPSYSIGTRIRYVKAEVTGALSQVDSLKYKRGQ